MTLQAKSYFLSRQATLVFCISIYLAIGEAGALRKHFNSPGNKISKRNVNYDNQRPTVILPYKTGVVPATPDYGYDNDQQDYEQYEEVYDSYTPPTYSSPGEYNVPSYSPQEYDFQTNYGSQQPTIVLPYKTGPLPVTPEYGYDQNDDFSDYDQYEDVYDSYTPQTYSSPGEYNVPTYSPQQYDFQTNYGNQQQTIILPYKTGPLPSTPEYGYDQTDDLSDYVQYDDVYDSYTPQTYSSPGEYNVPTYSPQGYDFQTNYGNQQPTIILPYKTGTLPSTPKYGYDQTDDLSDYVQYDDVYDSYTPPTYSSSQEYNVPSYSPPTYDFQTNYGNQQPTIILPYKTGTLPSTPEYGYEDVYDSYTPPTYTPPEYNVPSYSPQQYDVQTYSTPGYNAPTSEYDNIYNSAQYDSPTYSPSEYNPPTPTYSSQEYNVNIPEYDASTYSSSEEDYYDYNGPTSNGPHLSYGNNDNQEQVSSQPSLPSQTGGYGNNFGLGNLFGYGALPYNNYGVMPYAFPQPIQPIPQPIQYPALTFPNIPNYYPGAGQVYTPTVATATATPSQTSGLSSLLGILPIF